MAPGRELALDPKLASWGRPLNCYSSSVKWFMLTELSKSWMHLGGLAGCPLLGESGLPTGTASWYPFGTQKLLLSQDPSRFYSMIFWSINCAGFLLYINSFKEWIRHTRFHQNQQFVFKSYLIFNFESKHDEITLPRLSGPNSDSAVIHDPNRH